MHQKCYNVIRREGIFVAFWLKAENGQYLSGQLELVAFKSCLVWFRKFLRSIELTSGQIWLLLAPSVFVLLDSNKTKVIFYVRNGTQYLSILNYIYLVDLCAKVVDL